MDGWDTNDEAYHEPTEDERSARRVLTLAISLINARRPLSTVEIRRDLYPNMSDQAFLKAFSRDRERLVIAGLIIRKKVSGSETTWEADGEASFARENLLSTEDALLLDFLLLPIASDASFPYARDLRHALTKIDRSFDGSSTATLPPEARRRNNHLSRIEDCMTAGHALRMGYTRADGVPIERVLAPYGLFNFRDETYLVAARAGDDYREGEAPHTYKLARVTSVKPLPRIRFVRPADFDVRDFKRLPFQMGAPQYTATFFDPKSQVELTEDVANEGMAAAWAIAEGLRPTSPPSLVNEWHMRLTKAAEEESK